MTPEQLETVRLNARILAIESVLAALLSALTHSESARKSLLESLDELVARSGRVHLLGANAEYADLIAAETRDAFESLVTFLKSPLEE